MTLWLTKHFSITSREGVDRSLHCRLKANIRGVHVEACWGCEVVALVVLFGNHERDSTPSNCQHVSNTADIEISRTRQMPSTCLSERRLVPCVHACALWSVTPVCRRSNLKLSGGVALIIAVRRCLIRAAVGTAWLSGTLSNAQMTSLTSHIWRCSSSPKNLPLPGITLPCPDDWFAVIHSSLCSDSPSQVSQCGQHA
jgi:hypothetical protein